MTALKSLCLIYLQANRLIYALNLIHSVVGPHRSSVQVTLCHRLTLRLCFQRGEKGWFTALFTTAGDPCVIKKRMGDCVETISMPQGFSHPLKKRRETQEEEEEEGGGGGGGWKELRNLNPVWSEGGERGKRKEAGECLRESEGTGGQDRRQTSDCRFKNTPSVTRNRSFG